MASRCSSAVVLNQGLNHERREPGDLVKLKCRKGSADGSARNVLPIQQLRDISADVVPRHQAREIETRAPSPLVATPGHNRSLRPDSSICRRADARLE